MLELIPTDPLFYAAAIPAVVVTGISKGGFGGIALLAVPLMSLAVPPTEAAAIMLPLLLLMDLFGVRAWRGKADWAHLKIMLPGAAVGIIIGGLTASMVSPDMVRLMVGIIAIAFCLYSWWPKKGAADALNEPKAPTKDGIFWGAVAGYTSYIAHAGSPPYHTYLLPKKLAPGIFAATGVWFFALVNAGKLPAYILAGQLTEKSVVTAAVLAPLVPIGFKLGMWLNARVPHDLFYRIIYAAVFLSGIKLIYDAVV